MPVKLNMTRRDFLECVADYTEALFEDIRLPRNNDPEELREEDPETLFREDGMEMTKLNVYQMRLPDVTSVVSCAPYCLHQLVTGEDGLDDQGRPKSTVLLRSVFCIYHPLPQDLSLTYDHGAERAMEVAERFRYAILRDGMIADRFVLDIEDANVETLYYPDDMRPYYIAEIASTWRVPSVKREYRQYLGV